ncbi:MAG: M66 family metalloprotease [Myxococcota bacterium]|nr:M66 family metalloprotease [Myxococcota bacterium]
MTQWGIHSTLAVLVSLLGGALVGCSSSSAPEVTIDTGTETDLGTSSEEGSDTQDTASDTTSETTGETTTETITEEECNPEAGDDCRYLGVIDQVYFAQTHVLQADAALFKLVSHREALIKVQVIAEGQRPSPEVSATLHLGTSSHRLTLEGPSVLPTSFASDLGVVQHSHDNSFTGIIPKEWVQPGLTVVIEAAKDKVELSDLKIGAPTKVIMTMFDVHYFAFASGDYPTGWKEELEAKWPVSELELRRVRNVVFSELVIPPRSDLSAARVSSKADYLAQTGHNFDGEQVAALEWKSALKAAAGTSGRVSLYFVNLYGVSGGGQGGGFEGVGNGTSEGILHHDLGHALSLPHWGDNKDYPYKGDMYGIPAPAIYNGTHAGPTWAFHLPTRAFIPPTVQANAEGGTAGTYKGDPMEGGGVGDQEQGYIYRHFSDYSVHKMRDYLEEHVVVWNSDLSSWASWNPQTGDYTTTVTNNGVQFPVQRDVEVISVMASVSGANPDVNMIYPPIGPYTAGLIDVFDPSNSADRTKAELVFCPAGGCDVSLRIVQGGEEKVLLLAATWEPAADPLDDASLFTRAVNLPASDGQVTSVELLLTPDAEHNGLPNNPTVLASWSN